MAKTSFFLTIALLGCVTAEFLMAQINPARGQIQQGAQGIPGSQRGNEGGNAAGTSRESQLNPSSPLENRNFSQQEFQTYWDQRRLNINRDSTSRIFPTNQN